MKSLVIGSGFGGIAAALRLRAKGHDVALVEKHKDLVKQNGLYKQLWERELATNIVKSKK